MSAAKPNYLRPTNVRARYALPFWQGLLEHRLLGQRCACGAQLFPPRPRCPECWATALQWVELESRGTLHSWTVVHVASPDFDTPFTLGLVDLADGVGRIAAKVVGADAAQLEIGMPVRIGFLDLEQGFSLYCATLDQ
jgi:uncharacterized OB-fold protein